VEPVLRRMVKEFEKHPKDFNIGHILLTLFYAEEGLSRARLQELLGLGEGSVRSIIRYMKKHELVSTSKAGSILTRKGMNIIRKIRVLVPKICRISLEYLSVGKVNYAALLRGVKISEILKVRDMVVRFGGTGAVFLFYKEGRVEIPYVVEDLKSVSNRDYAKICEIDPQEGDSIIIVGGEDKSSALKALSSVLLELLTHQA
jgi:predicted transcriptional regulator